MTGAVLVVRADGIDAVERRLGRALAAFKDLTPLMDSIGAALESSTVDRFERGRGPDGRSWKPSRRALAESGQTLVDRGRLRDSITHAAHADRVEVGTNVVYAAVHQFGGRAGRGGAVELPARPYLGVSAEDTAGILDETRDYVAGLFR